MTIEEQVRAANPGVSNRELWKLVQIAIFGEAKEPVKKKKSRKEQGE